MLTMLFMALAIVAMAAGTGSQAASVTLEDYRLTAGDRIRVTVFGQPQLSDELVIDGVGNIDLPLLGSVPVGNLTVGEAEAAIHDRLADGFLRQPSVTVRVAELRPLYVLGEVRTPGVYPFRFGLTIKSAIALAGGYGPMAQMQAAALPDYLKADEQFRQLSRQKLTLLVRAARLQAQIAGQTSFTVSGIDPGLPGVDAIIAAEKELFTTQMELAARQIALLTAQSPRLDQQIDALGRELAAARKQMEVATAQVTRYDRLVKQGLGTSNADFQFRLTQSAQEISLWRLQADLSRLQVDRGDLDIKIQESKSAFARQAAQELREVRERLADLELTIPSARELLAVRLQSAGAREDDATNRATKITRMRNGTVTVLDASDITALEPGDTVEVQRQQPPQLSIHPAIHPAAAPAVPPGEEQNWTAR